MLKFLRKRKNIKRIMLVGATLIIPTFILWGVGSAIRGEKKSITDAGELFGRKIPLEEFYKSFNITRASLTRNYPIELPDELIVDMAWSRLILLEETRRRAIKVTNEELADEIKKLPQFQTNGVFDIALYKNTLKDRARLFEKEVRNDILIQKLKDIVSRDIRLLDDEVRTEYKAQNEKAKISYVLLQNDAFKDKVTVTDEELASYFNIHQQGFKKPVEVNLEYIEIPPDLIDKADEAISKNINELKDLSKLFSLDIKETGFFGPQDPIPGTGFVLDVYREAFELKHGETTNPIETSKGYIIIRLKERRKDYLPSLEEVKEKVKEVVSKQKANEAAKETVSQLYLFLQEAIKNNKDAKFDQVLQTQGVEMKQSQEFSKKDYIAGIGPASALKESAFSMNAGDISNVIEAETGFCIFRLDALIPIDEEKFKQEKDNFTSQLLFTKQQDYFNTWFKNLKFRANLKSNL